MFDNLSFSDIFFHLLSKVFSLFTCLVLLCYWTSQALVFMLAHLLTKGMFSDLCLLEDAVVAQSNITNDTTVQMGFLPCTTSTLA